MKFVLAPDSFKEV
ncbi:hypothetical protein CFSAN002369_20958 [Clostridium botulinum CFSAN002369]|nr:hypothetical protein CFSAN002369_20958 [Clostridium botulinum CFSAN002369]